MRHIILDTETTGLSVKEGHRIIEIGAIEMVNYALTGRVLHLYIQPERDIDEGAQAIHGISSEFLADKPVFRECVEKFLEFIQEDPLVIHNAPFDVGFLNAELHRCNQPELQNDRIIDTLALARAKFPGAQASLDALCRRFQIDNSHRDLHGALVDADLLAGVFVELEGGKQPGLALQDDAQLQDDPSDMTVTQDLNNSGFDMRHKTARPIRAHKPSDDELAAHHALIDTLKNPIWRQ